MPEQDLLLMTLCIFLPSFFALVLLFFPKGSEEYMRWWSLLGTSVTLVISLILLIDYLAFLDANPSGKGDQATLRPSEQTTIYSRADRTKIPEKFGKPRDGTDLISSVPWISRFNIDYYLGIDGISMPLILLTTVLFFLSMIASWNIEKYVKGYCVLFLVLETGVIGSFVALDFFLFYIFWEVMLLPMYFLIGIWGGPRREYAAIKFFLYTLFGSVFILIALLGFYFTDVRDFVDQRVVLAKAVAEPVRREGSGGRSALRETEIHTFDLTTLHKVGVEAQRILNGGKDNMRDKAAAELKAAKEAFDKAKAEKDAAEKAAAPFKTKMDALADRVNALTPPAPPDMGMGKAPAPKGGDGKGKGEKGKGDKGKGDKGKADKGKGDGGGSKADKNAALIAQLKAEYAELEEKAEVKDARVKEDQFNVAQFSLQEAEGKVRRLDQAFFQPWFQYTMFLFLLVGFAIKVPVFPFHTWLPDAHVEAPTPISMILAGILLKLGGYGIIRIAYPICPWAAEHLALTVASFGMINIVYGAFAAMAQTDFKKLVAYSSVSHMGYVLLGIAVWSATGSNSWSWGMNGAMYQMIGHGISSAGMFFCVGVIYDRAHHRNLDNFRGLYEPMPLYSGISAVIFFAALGLPGLCGFVGEFMVVLSTWNFAPIEAPYVGRIFAVLAALTVVITAAYILWTLQRVFMGTNPAYKDYPDISVRELLVIVPLVILCVLFGVAPFLILNWMEPHVTYLIDNLVQFSGRY